MNLRPVIEREMLVEARKPSTWWARLAASCLAAGAFAMMVMTETPDHLLGRRLFVVINQLLFLIIWMLVPLLTADALSQERRENTLGLLFLAGLNGREIVVGKGIAHALRGLNLILVNFPLLLLPVVLGGVGWPEVALALTYNFASILLALGTGLLASAVSRRWWRAQQLALALAALVMTGFTGLCLLAQQTVYRAWFHTITPANFAAQSVVDAVHPDWVSASTMERLLIQVREVAGGWHTSYGLGAIGDGWWNLRLAAGTPDYRFAVLGVAVGLLAGAVVGAWFMLTLAARFTADNWRDRPPSIRLQRWQASWFSPRYWKQLLRGQLAASLNRNPITWLYQYSWKPRTVKWLWFLIATVAGSLVLHEPTYYDSVIPAALRFVVLLFLMNIAYVATTSFRREEANGVLELLLVSPLPRGRIVSGRLRALGVQFAPALAMFTFIWAGIYFDLPERFYRLRFAFHWTEPLLLASSTGALMTLGCYQSLRFRSPLQGWLLTMTTALIVPVFAASGVTFALAELGNARLSGHWHPPASFGFWAAFILLTQLVLIATSWRRCLTLLAHHEFLFAHRTQTSGPPT